MRAIQLRQTGNRLAMAPKAPDLTRTAPRSPRTRLAGLVHLARALDKARAKGAGRLGEYLYPCPLDAHLLAFLGIDADDFMRAAQKRDDDTFVAWLKARGALRGTQEEIARWNAWFLHLGPTDKESTIHFNRLRNQIAPRRTDITAWVDLLDLDEGRTVPLHPSATDAS